MPKIQNFPLDDIQVLKFENFMLKQKMLERDMEDLKVTQAAVIKELFPEFNGKHQCSLDLREKVLRIHEVEREDQGE
jgi:hypothetical protein